jgi:hypothetical protein
VSAFAGAEICQFDDVAFHEYIFWFDIAMEDAFAVHEVDGS